MPRVTREQNPDGIQAVAPLQRSDHGGSGSFLVSATNREGELERYWCKTLNNFQDQPQGVTTPGRTRVPTAEQIVARLGVLLGAPVCTPELVYIPQDLVGWEIRLGTGRLLEEGWAHGSGAVPLAVETRDISASRTADDNARRQAGIYALHDWCCGQDVQWLMAGTENEFHSHDHGYYLPGGPAWTASSLQAGAAAPYAIGVNPTGLDQAELERLADRLDTVTEKEVTEVASKIPADWPVADDELEAVIDFAYGRRSEVAERLRTIAGAV